jgi:hypothetical protein
VPSAGHARMSFYQLFQEVGYERDSGNPGTGCSVPQYFYKIDVEIHGGFHGVIPLSKYLKAVNNDYEFGADLVNGKINAGATLSGGSMPGHRPKENC